MISQNSSAEIIQILENYIVILNGERDALPRSEASILIMLANREIDRIHALVADLQNSP